MNKICAKCGVEQHKDNFYRSSKNRDGLQSYCRSCALESRKTSYKKNPINGRKYDKERKKKLQQLVWDYLEDHPCVDCRESDPVVLQFDHVRGTKIAEVSSLLSWRYSWEKIKKEMRKCEIRCANCRTRKTAKDRNWFNGSIAQIE